MGHRRRSSRKREARESSKFARDPGSHPCPRVPVGLCPLLGQCLEVVLSGRRE